MKPFIKEFKMNYQPPKRRFEKSGFVNPETAYYVPLENVTNTDNEDMKTMVDHGRYFSIFAPRQSGKTTFFRRFAKELETNTEYVFILMTFEYCKNNDTATFYSYIQEKIYSQLLERLKNVHCHNLKAVQHFLNSHCLSKCNDFYSLFGELNKIITQKKIVIFIDEFDGIPPEEIETFLSTLRALYQDYKEQKDKALYSIGLVGIRNITQLVVGGVSPFNIADHVEIPPFTMQNIRDLYQQYTQETNQPFSEEAVQEIYEQTQGQPWLVNRLGTILTKQIKPETIDPIEIDDVNKAIQLLLLEKNAHFDNLKEKVMLYKETFNKINTQQVNFLPDDESQSWLYQYGLIRKQNDFAVISNTIYSKRFSDVSDKMNHMAQQKKKIFISYCQKDKDWLNIIMEHLDSLQYEDIDIWFDDKIKTGEQWNPVIADAIQTSHMTICLISKHYLNSAFIRTKEVPGILNKQKEGMIVFPILIKNCAWKVVSWLKKLQMFPENGISLEKMPEDEQENFLIKLIDQVHQAFHKGV
jgi:hypothetical protein